MRFVVIIPTLGRKEQVTRLLEHLEGQRTIAGRSDRLGAGRRPISRHIRGAPLPALICFGKKGLSAQRNNALVQALARSDIVTFLDDDFFPPHDYLERAVRSLR